MVPRTDFSVGPTSVRALTNRQVDVVSLVLHQHLSLWIRDLEEAMLSVGMNDSENHLEEALEIYQRAQKLQDMGTAFGM